MSQVIKPVDYQRLLDMRQTEQGIKLIKESSSCNSPLVCVAGPGY